MCILSPTQNLEFFFFFLLVAFEIALRFVDSKIYDSPRFLYIAPSCFHVLLLWIQFIKEFRGMVFISID